MSRSFVLVHSDPISGKKLNRIVMLKQAITMVQEPENGKGCIISIDGSLIPVKESFEDVATKFQGIS